MPREQCSNCERPLATCYCSALVHIANNVKVAIILHPLEEKHPFNTGRIAHFCLKNSALIVTETLSEKALDELLSTPSALLYPSLAWLPATTELSSQTKSENAAIQQLIVIDASWRKSKKILHLHPPLQTLPRINLTGGLNSNYQIRKTSIEDGLSTIESIAAAMQILEPTNDFNKLLQPFEFMIKLQNNHQDSAIKNDSGKHG